MKTLYLGNLPYSVTEQQVRDLIAPHATVISVKLVQNRHSGRPRGFGFVVVDTINVDGTVKQLDGSVLNDREIRVGEAKSDEQPVGARIPKNRASTQC